MAYTCDHCGKGKLRGQNITHHRGVAGGRWKRKAPKTKKVSRPNLHPVWVLEKGKRIRKSLCTSCLRTLKRSTLAKK